MVHIVGTPREQLTLLPESIEDYIATENPVRFIDAFVDTVDLDHSQNFGTVMRFAYQKRLSEYDNHSLLMESR